jgi:hypothetical protein
LRPKLPVLGSISPDSYSPLSSPGTLKYPSRPQFRPTAVA